MTAPPDATKVMVTGIATKIRVHEITFTSFVEGPIDSSIFAVPAGYKKTESLRYMPE